MNKIKLFIFILLAIHFLLSCSEKESDVVYPQFDEHRAMSHLVAQVDMGPRVPGSDSWSKCHKYFFNYLDSLNVTFVADSFSFVDPYSAKEIPLVNVIANINGTGDDKRKILLVAHYDSRPRIDYAQKQEDRERGLDGANDGASGVAVLFELISDLVEQQPTVSIEIVFVDGEDWGKSGDSKYYLLGSSEYARKVKSEEYYFGIVLDMIGDKDQQVYREEYSQRFAGEINDIVWNASKKLAISTFHDTVKYAIQDDHLPFNVAGIKTVDLIDFDYQYWHTEFDTPDKCSAESLGNIGRILLEIIYNSKQWQKNF